MEETKKCSCAQSGCGAWKKTLTRLFKVILGLGFLIFGGAAVIKFWPQLLAMIQGGLGLLLIMAGIIILALAKE